MVEDNCLLKIELEEAREALVKLKHRNQTLLGAVSQGESLVSEISAKEEYSVFIDNEKSKKLCKKGSFDMDWLI